MPIKGKPTDAWPDDLVETVKKLWAEGRSAGYIARSTGKTRNAIISKIHRLGLTRGTRRVYDPGIRTTRARSAPREARTLTLVAKIPPSPPPIYVEPPSSIPPDQRIKLVDLEAHHCRWPIGDPKHADFGFCGAHKTTASMYCQHHYLESRENLPAVRTGQFVLHEQRRRRA